MNVKPGGTYSNYRALSSQCSMRVGINPRPLSVSTLAYVLLDTREYTKILLTQAVPVPVRVTEAFGLRESRV